VIADLGKAAKIEYDRIASLSDAIIMHTLYGHIIGEVGSAMAHLHDTK